MAPASPLGLRRQHERPAALRGLGAGAAVEGLAQVLGVAPQARHQGVGWHHEAGRHRQLQPRHAGQRSALASRGGNLGAAGFVEAEDFHSSTIAIARTGAAVVPPT